MSRIFLSHSSANNAQALAVAAWLEQQGWSDYFLDIDADRGIAPGERWMAALTGAVDRCEAVLFLVSPAWRNSRYCFAEFFEAKKLGKRIFGVIVEPIALADLPEQMTAEWQVCDLTHADDPVPFHVARVPMVPPTEVSFPRAGLEALGRGLRKAGLDASTFLWPPEGDSERSPYPGLRALEEADAAVFFGREASIVRALDQLRLVRERGVEHLFVLLGASGAGKSSFLRAGLLPRLRRDSEHYVVLPPIRPERAAISGSEGLLASLQAALAATGQSASLAEVRAQLAEQGLADLLRRIESRGQPHDAVEGPIERTVVLPVDQGEELFAADGQAEVQPFLRHLEQLRGQIGAGPPSGSGQLRLLLLLAIRSDSLPRLQAQAALQALSPVLFSLPAMPTSEFKAVIEGPARRHGEAVKPLVIDPQLTEALMADARGADALPLLALTLEWLYREFTTAAGTRIGLEEYNRLGGVRGIIGKAVQRAFERPTSEPVIPSEPEAQEELLRQVFPQIATVDPDTGEWKRRVALRQVLRQSAPKADALVSRLIEQRLLRSDARPSGDTTEPVKVVEVAHEALLRQWETLERWLRAFAADLAATETIRRAADDWNRGGRDAVLLVHTAHRLEAAEKLLADERLRARFEPVDGQYLAICRERDRRQEQERQEQEQERQEQISKILKQQADRAAMQKRFTRGLIAFTVVVLALLGWSVRQTHVVSRKTSLVLASGAERAAREGRFDQGIRLGVLATKGSWLWPAHETARPALANAADQNTLRLKLPLTGRVNSAVFSRDGSRVLTASGDTARIWDAATGEQLGKTMRHQGPINSALFSSDGRRVVTASGYMARIWDAFTGEHLGKTKPHEHEVRSALFSSDGRRVLTASGDAARIWDPATGDQLGKTMRHQGPVNSALFSSDGRRVLTASGDIACIWDVATGKSLGEPMKHDDFVISAVFSSDGSRVVTHSVDRVDRFWDAATGQRLDILIKYNGEVASADFSRDGRRIVTASNNHTSNNHNARVWDTATGKSLSAPMQHEGRVDSVVFSNDGRRVLTVSLDKTVRIWDAASGKQLGDTLKHNDYVRSAVFSSDGRRVLTASGDTTVLVWDTDTGKQLGDPLKHNNYVRSAVFSSDGKRIVTASHDGTAHVWRDVETGKPIGTTLGKPHDNPMPQAEHVVSSVVFSSDGNRVVTALGDNTARVWDATTGKQLGKPMQHGSMVTSAFFSSDGKRIVTASNDTTAHIWDAATGNRLGGPMKHQGPVNSAVFSRDGRRVVTASNDTTARVWDVATGKPLGVPMKHDNWVNSAVFSSDGRRVVTASNDTTARVWDAATGKPLGAPMQHQGLVNSAVLSTDGRRVVTASNDTTARVWDAATGKPLGAPMKHDDFVISAVFSSDGRRVLTASDDKTARLWQESWSLINDPQQLIRKACGSMNLEARRITREDVELVPLITANGRKVGDDVCGGLAVTTSADPR